MSEILLPPKRIHELPEVQTVPDSYMIPCDSGSANYYVTAGNLRKSQFMISLPVDQAITASVDDLGDTTRHYFAQIDSSGHKDACVVPTNTSFLADIYVSSARFKTIILHSLSSDGRIWKKMKTSGTWGTWQLVHGSINMTSYVTWNVTPENNSSAFYLCGSSLIVNFNVNLPAATYAATTDICTISGITSPVTSRSAGLIGGSTPCIINVNTAGVLRFSNAKTISSGQYATAQLTVPISALTAFS